MKDNMKALLKVYLLLIAGSALMIGSVISIQGETDMVAIAVYLTGAILVLVAAYHLLKAAGPQTI